MIEMKPYEWNTTQKVQYFEDLIDLLDGKVHLNIKQQIRSESFGSDSLVIEDDDVDWKDALWLSTSTLSSPK